MSALFVSYVFEDKGGVGNGSCAIHNVPPVLQIEDVHSLSERLAKHFKFKKCSILNWRRFESPEPTTALNGVQLIAAERTRQIEDEKWSAEHDDKHTDNELLKAADSYLVAVITPDEEGDENGKARPAWDWPWDKEWWKPSIDPIRNLVKAGALIAAEIDRLQRRQDNGGAK